MKEDEVVLNINCKSDEIIPRSKYTSENGVDLRTLVQVGDEMEAKVARMNNGEGQVVLSYKRLTADRGNKRLEETFNNQEVLTAKVAQVLDGDLSVVIDKVRIFIPASLVSDSYEKDLSRYVGREIQFVVTEFSPRRRRAIGGRKQPMAARGAEVQKELFERIHVGDVVRDVIKSVTDFGTFIDLSGADGLFHISEMSWGRVKDPKKVFKSGETIEASIGDISDERIALSLEFLKANPWADAAAKYTVGNVVVSRVAHMTDFGALVEPEPGVDALLHVSQVSKEHAEKPSDVLKVNQEIEAKIIDFNEQDRKIGLSMKALEATAPEADVVNVDYSDTPVEE